MDVALLEALSRIGVVGLLILALVGGFREWYIYGPQHRRQVAEIRADRDYWRTTALRALGVTEKAIARAAAESATQDASDDA